MLAGEGGSGKGDDNGRQTTTEDRRRRRTDGDGGQERENERWGPRREQDTKKWHSAKVQFVCPLAYAI